MVVSPQCATVGQGTEPQEVSERNAGQQLTANVCQAQNEWPLMRKRMDGAVVGNLLQATGRQSEQLGTDPEEDDCAMGWFAGAAGRGEVPRPLLAITGGQRPVQNLRRRP